MRQTIINIILILFIPAIWLWPRDIKPNYEYVNKSTEITHPTGAVLVLNFKLPKNGRFIMVSDHLLGYYIESSTGIPNIIILCDLNDDIINLKNI